MFCLDKFGWSAERVEEIYGGYMRSKYTEHVCHLIFFVWGNFFWVFSSRNTVLIHLQDPAVPSNIGKLLKDLGGGFRSCFFFDLSIFTSGHMSTNISPCKIDENRP